MHRTRFPYRVIQNDPGPIYIGIGLAVVLLAQLWPTIPVAAAIALIGLGATVSLMGHLHQWILPLNWVIYVSLVALAVAAEFDLRPGSIVLADALLAGGITVLSMHASLVAGLGR